MRRSRRWAPPAAHPGVLGFRQDPDFLIPSLLLTERGTLFPSFERSRLDWEGKGSTPGCNSDLGLKVLASLFSQWFLQRLTSVSVFSWAILKQKMVPFGKRLILNVCYLSTVLTWLAVFMWLMWWLTSSSTVICLRSSYVLYVELQVLVSTSMLLIVMFLKHRSLQLSCPFVNLL
jgi:hypothetical protein